MARSGNGASGVIGAVNSVNRVVGQLGSRPSRYQNFPHQIEADSEEEGDSLNDEQFL